MPGMANTNTWASQRACLVLGTVTSAGGWGRGWEWEELSVGTRVQRGLNARLSVWTLPGE